MSATILMRPPQSHLNTSTSNTRFINCAQVSFRGRAGLNCSRLQPSHPPGVIGRDHERIFRLVDETRGDGLHTLPGISNAVDTALSIRFPIASPTSPRESCSTTVFNPRSRRTDFTVQGIRFTSPEHYVWPDSQRGKIDPNKPTSKWDTVRRRLRDKAGLPGLRFHDPRHTIITELADSKSPERCPSG